MMNGGLKCKDSNRPSCYSTKLIETDDPEATLGNWAVSG